ncbi:ATP synthase E chain-domain-containing protein [Staphylotrichum tortipilum]|uniref:ATP synthase F(0) complex subunit e, mitochondrial n=1 Tax=Staphylotrichum tortipilum TaxID=2831512 RepID=A0AAN6MLC9_9PEZI|nr:ATP synthase E chain-domain-containing protein [Staphylotrichum longicolle]
MSSKSGVNVLRYTVLGLGVFYGFSHQRSITAAQKAAEAQREYEHKQQIINKAKAAYAQSKQAASPAASASAASGVNQDLMSPNFDLEAFVEGIMQQK